MKRSKLCSAIVLIEIDGPEAMQRFLKRFKDCPRVAYIFTAIGGYNVIALVLAESKDTMESISMRNAPLEARKESVDLSFIQ